MKRMDSSKFKFLKEERALEKSASILNYVLIE